MIKLRRTSATPNFVKIDQWSRLSNGWNRRAPFFWTKMSVTASPLSRSVCQTTSCQPWKCFWGPRFDLIMFMGRKSPGKPQLFNPAFICKFLYVLNGEWLTKSYRRPQTKSGPMNRKLVLFLFQRTPFYRKYCSTIIRRPKNHSSFQMARDVKAETHWTMKKSRAGLTIGRWEYFFSGFPSICKHHSAVILRPTDVSYFVRYETRSPHARNSTIKLRLNSRLVLLLPALLMLSTWDACSPSCKSRKMLFSDKSLVASTDIVTPYCRRTSYHHTVIYKRRCDFKFALGLTSKRDWEEHELDTVFELYFLLLNISPFIRRMVYRRRSFESE